MLRSSIAVFHSVLALTAATGAVFVAGQAWVNLRWETGFYAQPSLLTQVMLSGGLLQLALASVQLVTSWGWVLGYRLAGVLLIAVSVLLALTLPGPMAWVVGLVSGIVLLDLLDGPEPTLSDPRDDEDDGP